MASHRSPSGAEADDPDRTTRLRVVANVGVRRLPPPPAATMHGRATVAAVVAGAVVAAGQTFASSFLPASAEESSGPLIPVATVANLSASGGADYAAEAIGGDQLRASPVSAALDPGEQIDIQSLTKAADMFHKQNSLIESALADGAPDAHIVNGEAFVRPAVGRLTSLFGARWGVTHYGIDIANAIGTPIYALTDGTVEDAGPATGFGLWVVLKHPDGTHSVYGHVNRMFVTVGEKVTAGEKIAEIGNRGQSTGPHLHLEIWDADQDKINPIPWLAKHGIVWPGVNS